MSTLIRLTEENDYYDKQEDDATILALGGKDTVLHSGNDSTINAGDGNDHISADGNNITIEGGEGDDSISNRGNNVTFIYDNENDGNDTINGFNETSTLQIGGGIGTYSIQTSGNDVIVTVGKSKITLAEAASLSSININGKENLTKEWKFAGGKATYVANGKTLVTVSGVKSAEGLSIDGTTVTVLNAALNGKNVTVSTGYTLAPGSDVATASTNSYTWIPSGTSAKYQLTESEYYTCDGSSITYVKPKITVVATISGLNKNFSVNDLGVNDKTITVNANALGTSKVTLKGAGYTLAPGSDVATTSTNSYTWIPSGTSAKYQLTESEYYTCDGSSITYVKPKITVVATISGLNKNFSANDLGVNDKTITVKANALGSSKVTLKGAGYTLAPGSDVATASTNSYTWIPSGTSAKYQLTESEYYTCDGSAITYVKPKITVVATISGLNKNFSANDLGVSDKTITVNANALGNSKVTLKGTGYTLAPGSDVATTSTNSYTWIPSGTSAKYQLTESEYYTCDGSSITYVKPKITVVATISGLNKNFSVNDLGVNDKTITVNANALGNSKVTLKGTGYTLAPGSDVATTSTNSYTWIPSGTSAKYQLTESEYYTCDGSSITYVKPKITVVATISGLNKNFSANDLGVNDKTITVNANALGTTKVTLKGTGYTLAPGSDVATTSTNSYTWIPSGTSAKYQLTESEYYTCDGSSITYVKPKITVVATISGLNKNFSVNDLGVNDKTITVKANALGTSKVSLKGTGYTLAPGSDVATASTNSYTWIPSGTSAKYQLTESEYYTCDGSSITYVKPKITVVATISGLNKNFSANDLDVNDKTITVNANALGNSKVTLKGAGYTLAPGSKVRKTPKSSYAWITSSNSAKFQLTESAYYTCDGSSITYVKENIMILATVNGLKKDYSINDIDISGTIITVKAKALSTSKVTISSKDFKLALGDDVATDTKSSPNWILKSTTSTLKNFTPAHYICDGTAITYVNEKELDTLATVNGVKKNLSSSNYDAATNTVKLTNNDLNDKVTISGTKAFSFANDYSGSITGSAAADTITVAGNSVSLNGGKGNDKIDLGKDSATFFYANGDGNDVIANFTTGKDKIVVTSGKASVAASGNNVVVTVGAGKITLTGAANQTFDIVDKKDKVLATYTAKSNKLLYSDNYGTQPQIDSLLTGNADYSVGEIETSNGTSLTQEKTQLTFGKK